MKQGINRPALERIVHAFTQVTPTFASDAFLSMALDGLASLELKERVHHVIAALAHVLPDSFEETASLMMQIKPHSDPGDPDDHLRGFAAWPLIDYVAVHGLSEPEIALPVLRELTPLFSAEFAIRHFLLSHFDTTYNALQEWANDPDEHVRRLVSEGIRTRLPWGIRLKPLIAEPDPILPLLDQLKDDDSLYVRRSVANNLNDLSKDHPDLVVDTCLRWQEDASTERQWVIKHATRTLVKQGHAGVFALLGFTPSPDVSVSSLAVTTPHIQLGEVAHFEVSLSSEADETQHFVLDYAMHFRKANGKTSPKVFKWKTLTLAPGESISLSKEHSIRAITTRKYYAGEQSVEILINGQPQQQASFQLSIPES
jgi:3-methyladenine DNA glycosylase AlkC